MGVTLLLQKLRSELPTHTSLPATQPLRRSCQQFKKFLSTNIHTRLLTFLLAKVGYEFTMIITRCVPIIRRFLWKKYCLQHNKCDRIFINARLLISRFCEAGCIHFYKELAN